MIFYLASLPNKEYQTLQAIFAAYEKGELVKVPKSKTGIASKMDCRGSNFKGLRNLNLPTVSALLDRIDNRNLALTRLSGECKDIKKLRQLKAEFVRQVGVGSWEQAAEYPAFATEEELRQKFLSLPFEKDMPAMVGYCQRAVR